MTSYKTKAGAQIPLVFKVKNQLYGFGITSAEESSLAMIRSAQSFLTKNSPAQIYLLSNSKKFEQLGLSIIKAPLMALI